MENKSITILVEREVYEKGGKSYYSYFIKGTLRGRDFKISVKPHDIGGYTALDIVFDDSMAAELVITPFEMPNERTGGTIKGSTLTVVSYDKDGTKYECPITTSRKSDKALFKMLTDHLSIGA